MVNDDREIVTTETCSSLSCCFGNNCRVHQQHAPDTSGAVPERCRPMGSAPSRRNVIGPSRRSVSRRRLRRSRAVICSRACAASAASACRWEPAAALALSVQNMRASACTNRNDHALGATPWPLPASDARGMALDPLGRGRVTVPQKCPQRPGSTAVACERCCQLQRLEQNGCSGDSQHRTPFSLC